MKFILIVGSLLAAPGVADSVQNLGDFEGSPAPPSELLRLTADRPNTSTLEFIGATGVPVFLNLPLPWSDVRFARFYPLPKEFAFSHGFRTKDSWFVSVLDIRRLELVPPPSFSGTLQLKVRYYRDNQDLIELPLLIELQDLRPTTKTAAQHPQNSEPLPSNTGSVAPPQQKRVSAEEERASLGHAQVLITAGDVSAARLLFEDLARRGSGRGARALAETYDPAYIKQMFSLGLQPNLETAKKWYQLAAELGDREATIRLTGLLGD